MQLKISAKNFLFQKKKKHDAILRKEHERIMDFIQSKNL